MNIILPIIFVALFIGLFSPRMNKSTWFSMGFFIALIIAYNYIKSP